MTVSEPASRSVGGPSVSAATSIRTFYKMLVRGQVTRGRLLGLGVLAALAVLLAVVARTAPASEQESAAVGVVSEYGIAIFLPLAALMLATPMLGNLIEDRLLVYLWLKPVPRWHLAVGAFGAVITTLLPLVVLPLALSALLSGLGSLVLPVIGAAILGVLAYSGIYLFLGARFAWGLWLGLLYLVLWENLLSRFSNGIAQLSIRSYLQTIVQRGTDVNIPLADRSDLGSVIIPILVALVAVGLTARALATRDVD